MIGRFETVRAVMIAAALAIAASTSPTMPVAHAQTPAQAPAAAQTPVDSSGTLAVTVTYKGKGEVSAKNEISVFVFSDPNINESSMPVGVGVVDANGGTATLSGLPPVVYIAVVYDEAGTYERDSAPPPGTPVFIHGMAAGAAEGVKTGKDAKVSVTFDDSTRM
jgi:hypothetical protein